jgi:ligand-binding sensor domain-containing protein
MKFIRIYLCLLAMLSCRLSSQDWQIYTSYRDVRSVDIRDNRVWAASTGGLFSFDVNNTSSISRFTSLDGLQSNELSSVVIGNDGNIWAGAFDGSISVYNPSSGMWRSVTDIKNSNEPSRRINAFYQYNNLMFFATEFCVVKFSIPQFQFVDQPYIFLGPLIPIKSPVYSLLVLNDTIWAGTKNGIAYANINSNLPIQSSWRNFTINNSVLRRNLINCISRFQNMILFGTDSGMVKYENGVLSNFEPLYNGIPFTDPVYRMVFTNGNLYFSAYRNVDNYRTDFKIYRVSISNPSTAELIYSGLEVNSLTSNSTGDLVIGTPRNGVDIFRNGTNNYVIPNGPFSNLFFNISTDKSGGLWSVSGSLGEWASRSGIYHLKNSQWRNYTFFEYPEMGDGCCGWVITYPDRAGNVWVAGFGNGLLKISGNQLTRYTEANSVLQSYGAAGFVLVQGIDEDNNGDLWVLNNRCQTNIVNFTRQVAYPIPVGNPFDVHFTDLVIDNYNTKWMTLHPTEGNIRGVMYFNENVNPRGNLLTYSLLGANISQVNDIVVDNNGEVWIATNNGVVVIPNPSQVLTNPGSIPNLFKMRIIEGGISTPLTENVLAIEVDALNNKWLGTISTGLLHVSPDGSTLLNRYNKSNSPLISDKVISIVSERNSGKVYLGFENGLMSLNTVAVNPLSECKNLSAGPNPFVIPSGDLLKIDGLVAESDIKIFTISGTLVAEFTSPGGRIALWDGRDLQGNYVSSGIYIITGYNKDASKVCTGKVAVVRR